MKIFSQEEIFLLFFIIGVIIGLIFDFFKVLRKAFKTKDLITFIEDLLFLFISGSLIVFGIIKLNGGEVRFYLFLGIFFGILIYSLTISKLYVIILYEFVRICKNIVVFFVNIFFKLLQIFKNIFNYIFKKLKNIGDT